MSEPDGTPAAVSDEMVDATAPILRSLMKSHGAPIGTEAAERWVRDILADVVPLIRAQVVAELSGWPFDAQVAEALRQLDRVGGVTPAEEEPTDVQAAFEAGEKGVTRRPAAEGQERSEEKPGPGEATTCPTCDRAIGVSRHGRLASHYKPGTLARCEGEDRG